MQKILGHKNPALTATVYADVLDRKVITEMERAFEEYSAPQK